MAIDPTNPATWPPTTPVARCGNDQGVLELETASRVTAAGPCSLARRFEFVELARSCPNNRVRRTTVAALLAAGGSLRASPGPPHHHDLWGLTPERVDPILGEPEPNPVVTEDRWTP
jgi:hypothetical protein